MSYAEQRIDAALSSFLLPITTSLTGFLNEIVCPTLGTLSRPISVEGGKLAAAKVCALEAQVHRERLRGYLCKVQAISLAMEDCSLDTPYLRDTCDLLNQTAVHLEQALQAVKLDGNRELRVVLEQFQIAERSVRQATEFVKEVHKRAVERNDHVAAAIAERREQNSGALPLDANRLKRRDAWLSIILSISGTVLLTILGTTLIDGAKEALVVLILVVGVSVLGAGACMGIEWFRHR